MGLPDKTVPNNIEAEEAVLGALLIDPEAIYRVVPFLQMDDFYLQKHRWVYEAMLRVHERRDPIDFLTLTSELAQQDRLDTVGGDAFISQLISAVPSAISVEAYGRLVEQTAVRRRLLDVASDIARLAYDESLAVDQVVDHSEKALFGVSQKRTTRGLQPIQEIVPRYYDHIEALYAHRGELMGVPSGFHDLDHILGGFQKSDLLILAARPGVGKTSLMHLRLACRSAAQGRSAVQSGDVCRAVSSAPGSPGEWHRCSEATSGGSLRMMSGLHLQRPLGTFRSFPSTSMTHRRSLCFSYARSVAVWRRNAGWTSFFWITCS